MKNELQLLKRVETFTLEIYPKLINFPKAEKYVLCSDIRSKLFNLYGVISQANYVKSKRLYYLQEAEADLEALKFTIKLARDRKYVSIGQYREIDLKLTEIGKMLSGYIKSTLNK